MHQRSTLKKATRLRRNRYRLKSRANGRLRLSVFFSGQHTYAQLIDDTMGHTLAAVSTLSSGDWANDNKKSGDQRSADGSKSKHKKPKSAQRLLGGNVAAARALGKVCGELLIKLGYTKIFLDRGCKIYHGRVAAFADAAREAGLEF